MPSKYSEKCYLLLHGSTFLLRVEEDSTTQIYHALPWKFKFVQMFALVSHGTMNALALTSLLIHAMVWEDKFLEERSGSYSVSAF